MKSPFPGMDPYLEQHWHNVSTALTVYLRDQLQPQLPRGLVARGVVTEPVALRGGNGLMVVRSVAIAQAPSCARAFTAILVLRPGDKVPGDWQARYRQELWELARKGVSLIEINLLRGGQRQLSVPSAHVPQKGSTPYWVCIRRAWQPEVAEVHAIPLREALPVIPVPLREGGAAVSLDLQALVDRCYRNGQHYEDIDYAVEPVPPLDPEDAAWADELLRSKGWRR